MTTVTIPKELIGKGELILISKEKYKKLMAAKRVVEFEPTAVGRRDLARARQNRAEGNFLTVDELKRKLGFTR